MIVLPLDARRGDLPQPGQHWSPEPRAQTVQTFQHQMLQPTRDFAQNISNLSFIVIAKYKLPEKPRIIAIYSA